MVEDSTPPSFLPVGVTQYSDQKQPRGFYTSGSQPIPEGSQGRNLSRDLEQKPRFAALLSGSCLAFLHNPRPPCPGNEAAQVGWTLLHQLTIKTVLTDKPTDQLDKDNSSIKSLHVTPGY